MAPNEMVAAIKAQCFKGGAASDAQLLMLVSFAKEYGLNPIAKECYAFVSDGRTNIGVQSDGWSKIANREPSFDGQEMEYEKDTQGNTVAITSKTYVKGREHPIVYRAMMNEWRRNTDVWKQMPTHQLYLKARNQGIRFAFGIPAYDPDDMERIEAAGVIETTARKVELKIDVPAAAVTTDGNTPAPEPETPEPAEHCQQKDCEVPGPLEAVEIQGDTFWLCAEHAKAHKPKRGRPRKVDVKGGDAHTTGDLSADNATAPTVTSGGGVADAQRAAGLEQIDPNETPLETFIRVHDVAEKRVKLACAKYGAEKVADLDEAARDAILAVLKKSYGEVA